MGKRAEADLHKHTLNLYAGDYERVQELFPDIGAAVIIRKIVRDFVQRTEMAAPNVDAKVSI